MTVRGTRLGTFCETVSKRCDREAAFTRPQQYDGLNKT